MILQTQVLTNQYRNATLPAVTVGNMKINLHISTITPMPIIMSTADTAITTCTVFLSQIVIYAIKLKTITAVITQPV